MMSAGTPAAGQVPSELDFAGFAQEFLRRNSAYRQDHARLLCRGGGDGAAIARESIARRWGLALPFPA